MEKRKISDRSCQLLMGLTRHFELKEGELLTAIQRSHTVSEPLTPRVKKELDLLVKKLIIQSIIHSFNQSINSGAGEKLFSKGDRAIPQHPFSNNWTYQTIVEEVGPNCNYFKMTPVGRPFCQN
jgi:hypothetical protein